MKVGRFGSSRSACVNDGKARVKKNKIPSLIVLFFPKNSFLLLLFSFLICENPLDETSLYLVSHRMEERRDVIWAHRSHVKSSIEQLLPPPDAASTRRGIESLPKMSFIDIYHQSLCADDIT